MVKEKRKFTKVLNETTGAYGMRIVTVEILSTGKNQEYKVFNDIWYPKQTADSLILVLDRLYSLDSRFRLHLGDIETGEDWLEENDVIGTMEVTNGEIKAPMLLATQRSTGGSLIYTDSIVKVVDIRSGSVLWELPNYQMPTFEVKQRGEDGFPHDLPVEYTTAVFLKGENVANFTNPERANGYMAFLRSEQQTTRPIKKVA
ncbi:hypothetical protein PP175_25485 (plasmid) [Aneurinibacillus sp. Ricciae_BoGa-3]|uniref:hypothetical protein n=1 Tax=Aneurinibacillus sp. Ricciae_BoGa-3 TaxID=3022697 RepID=UPI0023408827|nr:hypothetical protein [Aneurinibacillus sp. Ricciae_BoGa-3]WCK57423.1 hypothetical protein PP175_25485 [Aneurinibacillus sp. Ricciae_BoGa-3]